MGSDVRVGAIAALHCDSPLPLLAAHSGPGQTGCRGVSRIGFPCTCGVCPYLLVLDRTHLSALAMCMPLGAEPGNGHTPRDSHQFVVDGRHVGSSILRCDLLTPVPVLLRARAILTPMNVDVKGRTDGPSRTHPRPEPQHAMPRITGTCQARPTGFRRTENTGQARISSPSFRPPASSSRSAWNPAGQRAGRTGPFVHS